VPGRWPNYSKVRSGAISIGQWRPRGSVGYIVEVTELETGETLFLGAVPDADLDLISGH